MIKKTIVFAAFCLCALSSLSALEDIFGFWKRWNADTQTYQCLIAVYEYEGKAYGRIIGTYDVNGILDDTMYVPRTRAPGVVGNPYYCGLDFIYNLKPSERYWKGKIIDPKKGNVYSTQLWREDENLIIRGELFIFGRNETWYPATEEDFSRKFKKPDVTTFVPVIPQVQ